MGAFICQISEVDWQVSRRIGVFGNREGSDRRGEVKYFKSGSSTVQSIIEDLIGMRKGDLVFFHVIATAQGESTVHGVYRVREEPYYNKKKKLWTSSTDFVYPYRFGFEPHPSHVKLCKYDANILVSEFYTAIENRKIRSVLTLEREERGAAHAVKNITREDAKEITRLLYRDFPTQRLQQPVAFKPSKMHMSPLRNYIERIGEIEFPIKALVAYELGRKNRNLTRYIPACTATEYDFLIETFVGQTTRRPVDILCIGTKGSETLATIIEFKKEDADINCLVQALKYLETFRIRNVDRGSLTYKMSACLVAQKFEEELIRYVSARKLVIAWEEVVLLKYTPTPNAKDATFKTEPLLKPTVLSARTYPKVKIDSSQAHTNPEAFYAAFGKKKAPKTKIEFKSSEKNVTILQKHYLKKQQIYLSNVLIYELPGKCAIKEFTEFMNRLRIEAESLQGDYMVVEPVLVAEDYDTLIGFFIEQYNKYETRARRQPISAYIKA